MASDTDILSPATHNSGSLKGLIVGIAISTVVAIAGGAVIGMQFSSMVTPAVKDKKPKESEQHAPIASNYVGKLTVKNLPPVLTNLAAPKKAWVRMEAAIVVSGEEEDVELLAAQISQDNLAYLRTLTLSDIEGGSGLAYLRSDLNERASVRSKGRVLEVIIGSLVVE